MKNILLSPHKRLLIKIIPHHVSAVYKFEFSHLHIALAAASVVLIAAALLAGHVGAVRGAQAQVQTLRVVTETQHRQLDAFSQQTKIMWSRLAELQKQNQEIRRLTGIQAQPVQTMDSSSPETSSQRVPAHSSAGAQAGMGGGTAAESDASVLGLSVWTRMRSLLRYDRGLAFSRETKQLALLNQESTRVLADAMVLKAQAQISADAKREAALARERFLAAIPSIWPTNGYVSSGFGYRSYPEVGFHPGLDIVNDYGAPVYATAAGVVVEAGWNGGYGYKVVIDHGNGYETWYAHNSRLLVSVGQEVRKGQQIALLGASGFATGPHVHYQLLQWGKPIDPTPYLNGIPTQIAKI